MLASEPASFWREKLSNVRSFIVLQTVEGLTSSNKGKSANVSFENKYSEAFQGVYFIKIREKTVNQISYS